MEQPNIIIFFALLFHSKDHCLLPMLQFLQNLCGNKVPSERVYIGDDLSLLTYDSVKQTCSPSEPYKLTHAVIGICVTGQCRFKLNLKEYEIESPAMITFMPGQIIEDVVYSANFEGHAVILSKRFIDMVNLPGWQQHYMHMYHYPVNKISAESLLNLQIYFSVLHKAAANDENPFRLQVIENLIRAFYYGGINKFNYKEQDKVPLKNNVIERFIELVEEHYREERLIGFYADKLCITPKYLSKLVKENTGLSAGEWIENHVILEARALLQSSDMTIQQIAASLNFPNQSFFGKYFKRATGISPKQYRQTK